MTIAVGDTVKVIHKFPTNDYRYRSRGWIGRVERVFEEEGQTLVDVRFSPFEHVGWSYKPAHLEVGRAEWVAEQAEEDT